MCILYLKCAYIPSGTTVGIFVPKIFAITASSGARNRAFP